MIDTKTGFVRLSDSIVLNSHTKFESFQDLKLGWIQETRDMKNGYKWIDIKNLIVDQTYFIISLCFNPELLDSISFILRDHPFDLDSKWNILTEEDELKNLKRYDSWLTSELGEKRNFSWGEVWTDYDPKGGFSSIGLRYKKNPFRVTRRGL